MEINRLVIRKLLTRMIFFLILILLIVTAIDFWSNNHYTIAPSRPEKHISLNSNGMLLDVINGKTAKSNDIKQIKKYVDERYDCLDFCLQSIIRILYAHKDMLNEESQKMLKETLTGFKYWMDEPGSDGMCFWSENHQILFAATEYLVGQLYPNEVFINNGMTGKQHENKARNRILAWLNQRWKYGFTEWYSNTYYVEDIAPLSNLIDFADDQEIIMKSKIIMDLLLYDMASQSFKGTFVTTSGRLYEDKKKNGKNASTKKITESVFGYKKDLKKSGSMDLNFRHIKNYKVPDVIREIGQDTSPVIIKASNGLNVSELKKERLIGLEDHQIMMQWAMEAFTNPPVILNSLKYINKNNMFENEFLYDFKNINYSVLKFPFILYLVSKLLDPPTNGLAIQRANTYTFKTPYYSMYTAQEYHPGRYADQQHIFGITLSDDLSIFHTHPATLNKQDNSHGNTSSYWVGHGRLPHSVQHKNINLSLYMLPDKEGFLENNLINFTHLYFPKNRFDEVFLNKNVLFARYGNTYISFITKNELIYNPEHEEFIQDGQLTYWICEISHCEDETFQSFMKRINSNSVNFENQTLQYESNGEKFAVTYKGKFMLNGNYIGTEYKRFESPYVTEDRKPEEITISHNGKTLYLNFEKMIREEKID